MPTATLPTIKVRAGVVTAREVKDGDLCHFRLEFGPKDVRYGLAPASVARKWLEHGVREAPRTIQTGFVRAPEDQIGPMVAVRLRFGPAETINFLVLPEKARDWWDTAQRFEKLYDDYKRMMRGGR